MTRTVLDGRGRPRVLTPENCTCDGRAWTPEQWAEIDWSRAHFGKADGEAWVVAYSRAWGTPHYVEPTRWRITGLLP